MKCVSTSWKLFAAIAVLATAIRPLSASIPVAERGAFDCLHGRRTAAIKPSGATDSFGYDGLGNQTTYTNAEGRVYTMTYDALSRPLAATNALGQQVFLNSYDLAGNLTNRLDGAGNATAYSYDALNRLVSLRLPVSALNYSYDTVGNLMSASNAVSQNTFAYDAMDRVSSAYTTVAGHSFETFWSRDTGGLVTNLTYAPGKAVVRAYDADGRLTSVTDWLGHTWTFAWDGEGKPMNILTRSHEGHEESVHT